MLRFAITALILVLLSCATRYGGRDVPSDQVQVITGGLKSADVQGVIKKQVPTVLQCYERNVRRTDGYEGVVRLRFTIDPQGVVRLPRIADDTLGIESVDECLKRLALTWRFPKPRGGSPVDVSYPFSYNADDEGGLNLKAVKEAVDGIRLQLTDCRGEFSPEQKGSVRLYFDRGGKVAKIDILEQKQKPLAIYPCLHRVLKTAKAYPVKDKRVLFVSTIVRVNTPD